MQINLIHLGVFVFGPTIDKDGDGTPDEFRSDFGILNPILGVQYIGWKMPMNIAGEYIHNTRARGNEDRGWAIGAALGEAREQGD